MLVRASASLGLVLIFAGAAAAQKPTPRPHPATQTVPTSQLPITRVALYKNGVGFFEHSGRVLGDQSVTIDFTSAQLNDVLQSLTAIDLQGGRISGAGYNSTTPLDQQLKALPLGLSGDPSDIDFYTAIRGSRVAVSGPGVAITGRLLSIDLRPNSHGSDASDSDSKPSRRFVTVVAEAGQVRTVELTPAVTVTLLDTALHTDVTRYLELLAANRNQGLRHLTILDRGTGARDLKVSYISEVPVWKSTYRILFTDGKGPTATLQGWSVVDNTTGSDWINIHLDLIAGAPQSFIQPLSTPYYTRRPEIALPSEAQLEPQTHQSGDENVADVAQLSPGVTDQIQAQSFPQQRENRSVAKSSIHGTSVDGAVSLPMLRRAAPVMAAPPKPMDYAEAAQASFAAQSTSTAFDDFFEYTLTDPITIRKNESALVPILQTRLPIERVTLWSAQQPQALRALWVTNSSTLTLDRGSFSIVENGSFGGEGLLDPIHPGERRLLSYAADQAVTVDPKFTTQRKLRSVTISKGVLVEHERDRDDREYTIRNAGSEPRTVLVEHARTGSFDLSPESSQKPEETTAKLYRFRVEVAPHSTAHLTVIETHSSPQRIQLGSLNDQQVRVLIDQLGPGPSPAMMAQLQPVIDAQRTLADLNHKRVEINGQLTRLRGEEERQRANIVALKDTDKIAQKRFVDELGRIEDNILDQGKQLDALEKQIAAAQQDLADKVSRITFELKLD